jgi:4-hydroxy-2-oxoheptanedioate aldolase
MTDNLLQKIKKGDNIYGTCIVSTSPIWSKVVGSSGLDYVFLDTEHIPMDRTELTFLCQTYRAMGISPIVRIPSPDPYAACMVKDAGAVGVIAPYIETVEQIREMVGATKYRPLKGERLQNVLKGKEKLEPELMEYLENFNEGSMCIVNIESIAAGLPEQYEHPEYEKVVKEIIQKTRSKGLAAGIHFPGNPERQIKWMKEGANIVMHSSDMFLFSQKLDEDITKIKEAAGDKIAKPGESDLAI